MNTLELPDRRFPTPRQAERIAALLATLPDNPFYRRKFAPHAATLDALCAGRRDVWIDLPPTTKAELVADQADHPPYGSNLGLPPRQFARMHQTSGTTSGQLLRWLDTPQSWDWMVGLWRIKFAMMGLEPDDRLFFPFSFGPFLGFWVGFEAGARGGYFTLPGGGMSTLARLQCLRDHAITVLFCTPSYALRLAEVAEAENFPLRDLPVRMLVVAGEPGGSIPATRERITQAWNARVFDHYGLTEIGPIAVECLPRPGGMHVLEDDYVVEILDPGGLDPRPPGAVGELVLTNLGRLASPLIRYRTGDLARLDLRPCACGKSWAWLEGGILGRRDDMIHLRGNNVYPSALEAVLRRFPEVAEFRIVVDQAGALGDLRIEVEPRPEAVASGLPERLGRAIRDALSFRARIVEMPVGALPRFDLKAKRVIHTGGPRLPAPDAKGPT